MKIKKSFYEKYFKRDYAFRKNSIKLKIFNYYIFIIFINITSILTSFTVVIYKYSLFFHINIITYYFVINIFLVSKIITHCFVINVFFISLYFSFQHYISTRCFFFVDIITTHRIQTIFDQRFFHYFSLFYQHYQCYFSSITLIFDLRCAFSIYLSLNILLKFRNNTFCRDYSFFDCLFFFSIFLNLFKHRIDDYFILNAIVIFASIEFILRIN